MKRVSNDYVSAFCLEIALVLKAGINIADGIRLMMDDEKDRYSYEILQRLSMSLDKGSEFSSALREIGKFPEYMVNLVYVAERTGRLEETFSSLAEYFDNKERLRRGLISSIIYPGVLFLIMLIIIVLLVVKVLPIFNEVYLQIGTGMTGLAGWLLGLGDLLSSVMPVLAGVLVLIIAGMIAAVTNQSFRSRAITIFNKVSGIKGISWKLFTAKFASALSMAIKSGLNTEESVRLAYSVNPATPEISKRMDICLEILERGEGLSDALYKSGIFPAKYCRMLALGAKSGNTDIVISEIARRMQVSVEERLDSIIGKIEPTLVIVSSLIVGAIILTVMLPLMNIMAIIG